LAVLASSARCVSSCAEIASFSWVRGRVGVRVRVRGRVRVRVRIGVRG
jgi:hypothetical protein